jgi:hypothetical protein
VAFRDQPLTVLRIKGSDTRKGQLTLAGRDTLSEERLPGLALQRGAPVAHVQNQGAIGWSVLENAAKTESRPASSVMSSRTPQHKIAPYLEAGRCEMSPTVSETTAAGSAIARVATWCRGGLERRKAPTRPHHPTGNTLRRSIVLCALPRAIAAITVYQRDSSSKRP